MAKPKFYLYDKHSDKPTIIVLRWQINKKRFVYSARQSVKPSLWSSNKQRVLPRHPDAPAINKILDHIEKSALAAYADLLTEKGFVRFADLRERLDIATGKVKGSDTLFNFIDALTEERANSKEYKEQTIKGYVQMRNKLREFAKHERKEEYDFADMDYQFFVRFVAYLQDQGFTNSYTKKIVDRLRVFLNEATRRKINKFRDYELASVKLEADESNEIYLTKQELEQLYRLDLSDRKRHERVRDLFLIGAYTGLRFSDYSRLSTKHIKETEGHEMIVIVTRKTKEELIIPLHPYVREILDRYKGKAPKATDVEVNRTIKQIGKDCGFLNDTINFKRHEGGELVVQQIPRWEMLKTHTGRRSFATNAYLDGWSSIAIMQITGHKTETNFMKYIRVTKEQNALALAKSEAHRLSPISAKVHEVAILAKQNAEKWGLTEEELQTLERIRAKVNKQTKGSALRVVNA